MPFPLKLRAHGRGLQYSKARGLVESTLRLAYRGAWPARAWAHIPGATRVREICHELPLLPRRQGHRPPLRVAFVSDLHLGPTTPQGTLDAAFALLGQMQPDLLVLGGDYVFLEATHSIVQELEHRVRAVPALTKVAVLGNHDLWTHHSRIEAALERAGARVLVNDACQLPAPYEDVVILGLDDPWTGQVDAPRALASCGSAALRLAVCHSPEGFPSVRHQHVALCLCGHTHGGQIALPGPRPVVLPPGRHCRAWPYGLHNFGDAHLFVSRGIGTTELPIRAYAPPDVALFILNEP